MRPLSAGTMRFAVSTALLGAWIALGTLALARANVITDWDEKGVAFVTSNIVGPAGTRAMAMVHVAMFDAVNSIERRYRPYLVQLPVAPITSKEAAAAAAAAAVLAGLVPVNSRAWEEMKAATANYLATLPEGEAKLNGIKLGEMVATRSWRRGRTMAPMRWMPIGRGPRPAPTYRPRYWLPRRGRI